jgi:hypothetical protein
LWAGTAAGPAAVIIPGTTAEIATAATVMATATAATTTTTLTVVALLAFATVGAATGLAAFAGS